jgi:uncharacterized protein YcnI
MKSRLLYIFSLMLLALPLTALAAQKNAGNVTLGEPVTVGSTVLNAGDYKVKWEGTGSAVEVTFLQGKKEIATVPATVTAEASFYDGAAVETQDQNDNSKILEKIMWKNVTLTFGEPSAAQGN